MTIPRLNAFAEYWDEAPPVNELVVAIFSSDESQSTSKAKPEELSFGDVEDLISAHLIQNP